MYRLIRLPAQVLALALPWLMACFLAGFAMPPASAESTFEVGNIHVDASAKSVAEARSAAIASGRPVAWSTLFRRLTRQQDWARQPVLDAAALQKLVIGYFPVNERRSTTRYVADLTYTFNPEAVARVLQTAGIPYTAVAAKKVLLVPMAPGFARGSMWTTAFASPRFAASPVPFAVPVGDPQEMTYLGGLNFDTATWDQVAPVASRIHATEAVLVLAAPVGNKLAVTIKRIGMGVMPMKSSFEVPLLQGAQSTYPGAADATVRAIDDMWKNQKAVDYSQKGKLTADVHIGSLAQFAAIENAIAGVPNVASVSIAAMDIGEARLTITYIGTTDQLRAALAQAGVALTGRGAGWQVTQGAGAGQP
jgi:hypothetical protein